MPDPLHQAIARAIRQPLDGDAFERCALDLLRSAYYPGLRPIPPKRDAGMDGIAGPDSDPEFVLVVTTAKQYERNLHASIERYRQAGGSARAFAFATTQQVTGESRLRQVVNTQWGVDQLAIHDRGEFEKLLYHSPQWRKDLLGVTGAFGALSRYPVRMRPAFPLPPVGRDSVLERLRSSSGDIVLEGKPGVGKTFLLDQLAEEEWCLFDIGRGRGKVADAIRDMRPRRVVLNDAHIDLKRISKIDHLRQEVDKDFGIVAVSWPGWADDVADRLPNAERIVVDELDRDRIVEIIEAAGVTGPVALQRLIVDQSRGLPGLASALAGACVADRIRNVADGKEILAVLARRYRDVLGAEHHDALGVLALAGDAGATVKQVAKRLGLDLPKTRALIKGLMSGGTLGEGAGRGMNVQPPDLRYPLVYDVFYNDPVLDDPERVVAAFDNPSSAALPLIGAAHRGADVDREWLRKLIDWSDEQSAMEYACLGSRELREALELSPGAWAETASAVFALGTREREAWAAERRTAIASAAYRHGADAKYALRVLMETAVVRKSIDAFGTDPLDIVRSRLAGFGAGLGERRMAVEVADQWLRDGGDADVGVRVMTHAVQLEMSDAAIDPGLGNTLMLSSAIVPASWIEPLSNIWDAILDAAEHRPDIHVRPLIAALEPWAWPAIILRHGRPGERRALPDEATETMRATAARAIERLAVILREHPGALHLLRVFAQQREVAVHIDRPDDFATLYPMRDPRDRGSSVADWQKRERREIEAVSRVADTFAGIPLAKAAERIVFFAREADEADIGWPPGARRLAQALAERLDEPEALLDALIEAGADAEVVVAPLDRVVVRRRPGWEAVLERLLGDAATADAAVGVALMRPAKEYLKRLAIDKATPHLVHKIIAREDIDQATLGFLLDATDPVIARTVALELREPDDERLSKLSPEMRGRWQQIVVNCPIPDDDGFAKWALGEILERNSAICADWVQSWFERRRNDTGRYEDIASVQVAIENLSADIRTKLIANVPVDAPPFSLQSVVHLLVVGNIKAAEAFFDRPACEHLRPLALKGDISAEWMERALLALKRGWTPESVVAARHIGSFEGPYSSESQHWQQRIDAFESLRPSPGEPDADHRLRIIAAGVARYRAERDGAIDRERRERIYGRR